MSRDFRHFFIKKLHLGPYEPTNEQAKRFRQIFRFCKNMCLRSQQLRRHGVSVANNYADMKSAWHNVSVVNADIELA